CTQPDRLREQTGDVAPDSCGMVHMLCWLSIDPLRLSERAREGRDRRIRGSTDQSLRGTHPRSAGTGGNVCPSPSLTQDSSLRQTCPVLPPARMTSRFLLANTSCVSVAAFGAPPANGPPPWWPWIDSLEVNASVWKCPPAPLPPRSPRV